MGGKILPKAFQSSVVSYKATYCYIPFAVRKLFVGRDRLRIITLEIEGFRVVKPREKAGPFALNRFFDNQD